MTTDTEALRAQFEREIGEAAPFPVQRYGDSYANRICAWAWEGYQAGHAAAKAETADVGEPAAWMAVLTHPRSQGPQAHFVSDAKLASQWKYNGVVDGEPCIVQPLFTAPQLAAAVAAEREKCAQVCDRLSVNQPWDYDASTRASAARDCAAAIRAGAPPDTLREAGAVAGGAA